MGRLVHSIDSSGSKNVGINAFSILICIYKILCDSWTYILFLIYILFNSQYNYVVHEAINSVGGKTISALIVVLHNSILHK